MQIQAQTVQRFKDWFFGRVPEYQYEDEFEADVIYVNSESDLPRDGQEDVSYAVAETGDTYRFKDGIYTVVNPYVFGVEECYRDKPRTIQVKDVIVDLSYELPSISAEQVKAGGSASLATLYNIVALRVDLAQIKSIYVNGYRTTLMEYLGRGVNSEADRNVTEWFRKEHSLLYRLLLSSYPSEHAFHKGVVDALFHHGYILTWDAAKGRAMFKVDDFQVYL